MRTIANRAKTASGYCLVNAKYISYVKTVFPLSVLRVYDQSVFFTSGYVLFVVNTNDEREYVPFSITSVAPFRVMDMEYSVSVNTYVEVFQSQYQVPAKLSVVASEFDEEEPPSLQDTIESSKVQATASRIVVQVWIGFFIESHSS